MPRPAILAATLCATACAVALAPCTARAQAHAHASHAAAPAAATTPSAPGQAAYAAIAEIVRILEADPATDWSRVDVERLRRHLVDMDEVTLRAEVRQDTVPGGARFTVRGPGRTVGAIQRMAAAHAAMLGRERGERVTVEPLPDGARVTVLATTTDAAAVARLRALGFVGLLATGDHHGAHHLALARGQAVAGHAH